jgi:uncharacterized membrane protein
VSVSSILLINNRIFKELSPYTGFIGILLASRVILPSIVGIRIIYYRLLKGLAALVALFMSTPTL